MPDDSAQSAVGTEREPVDGNVVVELGDRLQGAVATMAGEADELAARRPHPDAHLYDVEEGLRRRSEELNAFLEANYYR